MKQIDKSTYLRVLELINWAVNNRSVNMASFANEYEVSERSLVRDMAWALENFGILFEPIKFDRYVIRDEVSFIAPMLISKDVLRLMDKTATMLDQAKQPAAAKAIRTLKAQFEDMALVLNGDPAELPEVLRMSYIDVAIRNGEKVTAASLAKAFGVCPRTASSSSSLSSR